MAKDLSLTSEIQIDRLTAASNCRFSAPILTSIPSWRYHAGTHDAPEPVDGAAPCCTTPIMGCPAAGSISVDPQKSVTAESFKSGRLPAALPIPTGDPDKAIQTLVEQIAAKDHNSTAATLTAMQLTGYTIIDKAGRKVVAPSNGKDQGMALEDGEMATTAKMYGEGRRMSLAELADALRIAVPQLAQSDLPTLLL